MELFNAFIVAGVICLLAQLLHDFLNFKPGEITSMFVALGAVMNFFGIYDKLVAFSGGGALVPITSFGHSLTHASLASVREHGFFGILTGTFSLTTSGITSAVVCAFLVALIFKPRQ